MMSAPSEGFTLHKTVRRRYLSLAQGAECLVTYVWIDETGENLLSKTRTLHKEPAGIRDIPEWTAVEADKHLTEVTLAPVKMFRDPFTLEPNKLVLCEVLDSDHAPTGSNQRARCVKAMEKVKDSQPWFGMEQEYTLFGLDGRPFGWPPQGCQFTKVSCAVGIDKVYGRDVCISHYRACLYAGVAICGVNSESLPSQWEFQIGPCEGIETGDHLWMARYVLHRVCEDFGVVASLEVKPREDHIATSGCHTNFSTKEMRSEEGLQYIEEAVRRLSTRHPQHIRVYDPHGGADNMRRLVSKRSTSSFHVFSSATARRDVSVRIPGHVSQSGRGYLEDRRPAANCDPYSVMRALVETCLLGASEEEGDADEETTAS